jgi:hypothetical protein
MWQKLNTRDRNLMETLKESVTPYISSLWVRNLIADRGWGDPDGRNAQSGMTDWIG